MRDIKLTVRAARTFYTITRVVRPTIRVTKRGILAILDHLSVVTLTYGALETLLLVVTGHQGYQNDRANPADILSHLTPLSVES